MVQLGALFGIDRRTELLILCVVGVVFAMFDESLLDLNANIQSVWRAEIPREVMSAVAQQAIKTVLVVVLVVRTYVSYLQLVSYIGVFWPLVFETHRWLITAWLLVSGVQQLVLTVMTAAMGTLVCARVGSARPACVQFTIAQCCRFVPAAYFWYSMYSYYREMGCETSSTERILSAAIASASSDELRASEIGDLRKFETALRRRQVRSMVANSPGYNGSDESFVSDGSNADIECDVRLTKSSNDSSRCSEFLSNIPSVGCPRSLDTLFTSTSTKSDENCVSGGDSDDTELDIEEMANVADKVKRLLNISESDIEAAKCASPIDWTFFSTKRPDLCLQIATHRPLLNSARVSKDVDAEQDATEQMAKRKTKRGLETVVKHSRDKTDNYEATKSLTVEDFHENVSKIEDVSNKTAPELQINTLAVNSIDQEHPVSSSLSGPNTSSNHDSYMDASLYSSSDGDAVRQNASGISDFSNMSEFVDTDLKIDPTPKPKKKKEPKTETAEALKKIGEGLQNQNESSEEKSNENKEESKNNDGGNESKTQDCEVSKSDKTLVDEESNMNVVHVDSNVYFIVEKDLELGIDANKTESEKDKSKIDLKKSKSSQISVVNVKSNTYVIKSKANTPKTANAKIRTSSFRKPAERNKIDGEVVKKTGSGKSVASASEEQKDMLNVSSNIYVLKKTSKGSQNENKPVVNKNMRSKPSIYVMNCKSKLKGIENKVNVSARPSSNNHPIGFNVPAKPELVIGLKKNVIRARDYQFSSDIKNRTEIGIYTRSVVEPQQKELARLDLADLQVNRILPDSPAGSTSMFNRNTFIKNKEVSCQASSIYKKFLVNNYDELRNKLEKEKRGKKGLPHGFAGKKELGRDFDNVFSGTKRKNL